jgi:hypothetical protein
MFANSMLITSFFASLLCSIWLIILGEYFFLSKLNYSFKIWQKFFLTIFRISILIVLNLLFKQNLLKKLFSNEEDDSHIWDILKSKLNNELHTFDTRLYTCAKEFDYLEISTFFKLVETGLLVIVAINFIFYALKILKEYFLNSQEYKENEENDDLNNEFNIIVYNMIQLLAFSLMAVLIMRLKLLWVPHLCILASFIANNNQFFNIIDCLLEAKFFENLKKKYPTNLRTVILILIIAIISYNGIKNINKQYEIQGEYNDYTLENVMNWINKNTKEQDPLVGKKKTYYFILYFI